MTKKKKKKEEYIVTMSDVWKPNGGSKLVWKMEPSFGFCGEISNLSLVACLPVR